MGYFANGTESMIYEEKYCSKCIHNEDCTISLLHLTHNYDECNNDDSMLHVLIPRNEKGFNEKCTMFIDGPIHENLNYCSLCKKNFPDMIDYVNHLEACK